jgi:hypothetical protein
MLNNITNFFNLIKTGKVKTQLDATDLLPIGTKDLRFSGQYQPTMIKYGDFISGLVGGSNGQVLFNDNDTIAGASNLYWDEPNNRFIIGANTASNVRANITEFNIQANGLTVPTNGSQLMFNLVGSGQGMSITNQNGITYRIGQYLYVNTLSLGLGGASSMNLYTTGNIGINTTTDAGYKLDVNGTFRASDSLIASSSGGGAYKLTVQQTGVGQGNTFRVIQLGYSMIDVNTSGVSFMPFPSPSGTVGITNWTSTGGSGLTFFTKNSEFTPQGGAQAIPLIKFPNPSAPIVMGATATVDLRAYLTVSGGFNATSGLATGQQILSALTATANNDALIGLDINNTFTNGAFTGVTNLGLRMQSGVAVFGATNYTNMLYGAVPRLFVSGGTYLNGITQIGSSNIYINGNNIAWENTGIANNLPEWRADATGIKFGNYSTLPLRIGIGASENARFFSTGNVAIGSTSDAGFRLDVNGTARVSSTTTIGTSAHPFASNLLTLISDQGSASFRIGGGNAVVCTSSISAVNLSSNDFVQCVRVLVGGAARINATTTDWLSVTNWAQSSLGSGNVSANLATFGTAYATINASAQVEIASTTKGFLPPRMDSTQKNAISGPAAGLMIYDTTLNRPCFYNGTTWITL